jgi:hypothetical protein
LAIWTASAAHSSRASVLSRRVTRPVILAAGAVLIALAAVLAFLAGEHHQRPLTILTGVATVGDHQATVTVAGWSYAIEGDSIMWVDQQGSTHDGGWPSCLSGFGQTVPISFGEVPVTAPNGLAWRQVVWVDCNP